MLFRSSNKTLRPFIQQRVVKTKSTKICDGKEKRKKKNENMRIYVVWPYGLYLRDKSLKSYIFSYIFLDNTLRYIYNRIIILHTKVFFFFKLEF